MCSVPKACALFRHFHIPQCSGLDGFLRTSKCIQMLHVAAPVFAEIPKVLRKVVFSDFQRCVAQPRAFLCAALSLQTSAPLTFAPAWPSLLDHPAARNYCAQHFTSLLSVTHVSLVPSLLISLHCCNFPSEVRLPDFLRSTRCVLITKEPGTWCAPFCRCIGSVRNHD